MLSFVTFSFHQTFQVHAHTHRHTRVVCIHSVHKLLQKANRERGKGMTIDWKESQYRTEEEKKQQRTLKCYTYCVCFTFKPMLPFESVKLHTTALNSDALDTLSNECVSSFQMLHRRVNKLFSLFLDLNALCPPCSLCNLCCWCVKESRWSLSMKRNGVKWAFHL